MLITIEKDKFLSRILNKIDSGYNDDQWMWNGATRQVWSTSYPFSCVNPEHLEAVTPEENRDRYYPFRNQSKLYCPHNHPYSKENTGYTKTRINSLGTVVGGKQYCKTCKKLNTRRWRNDKSIR